MELQPRAVGTEYAPDGTAAVDRRHLGIIGQLEVRPEARADGSASVSPRSPHLSAPSTQVQSILWAAHPPSIQAIFIFGW